MIVSIWMHGNKGYISKAYYLYHINEENINKMQQAVFIRLHCTIYMDRLSFVTIS